MFSSSTELVAHLGEIEIPLEPGLSDNEFLNLLSSHKIMHNYYKDVRQNLLQAYQTGYFKLILIQGQSI